MSTQVDLFTTVEPTSVSPAIAKLPVSRSTFYRGDCLVEMSKIADKSVDMILCDLPYGTTKNKWDVIIPFGFMWEQYERVIKENGAIVLFSQQPFTTSLICSNKDFFRYDIIWDKVMTSGFLNANRMPLRSHEHILVFYKKLPTYNPQKREISGSFGKKGKNAVNNTYGDFEYKDDRYKKGFGHPKSIITIAKPNNLFNDGNLHPTQKPVELMEYLIKTYTNEGETVLDNCMGSGTTGVACKKTGRHFIGIEKDEKYFEIAVSRVSAYCG